MLEGRTVRSVRTTRPSYLFVTSPGRLRRRLPGRRVEQLQRRGKYLIAELDDESRLVVHLGMTGQLFSSGVASVRLLSAAARAALSPEEQIRFRPDEHTHLQLHFSDRGPSIYLRDVRKFGKVLLLRPGEPHARLERLGIDALEATGDDLFRATRKRVAKVKDVLLGQSVIAGVGNIYADEALFLARVRPTRQAGRVTRAEYERIADAVKRVMLRSIEAGGSSIRDFVSPNGRDGLYQDERRVYARTGEPCVDCGSAIRRTVLGQRGTHYCARCQV